MPYPNYLQVLVCTLDLLIICLYNLRQVQILPHLADEDTETLGSTATK